MRAHTAVPNEPISNVAALRIVRPPARHTPRPFDWEADEFTHTAVHLLLTPLEINHAIAWLEHDDAPAAIREIGAKVRHQITSGDDR